MTPRWLVFLIGIQAGNMAMYYAPESWVSWWRLIIASSLILGLSVTWWRDLRQAKESVT